MSRRMPCNHLLTMASIEDIVVQPPHTATWLVHINRSIWVGGVRGLMLQALHPLAMRGVWQNSNFQQDPFGSTRCTADFVGRVTFGTPSEADEIGRRVRGIHRQLRINDPDTGRTHRVDDPELLLWVHCAEISSYLAVARRSGLGLSDRQADRYVAEQRRSATYVGLDPRRGRARFRAGTGGVPHLHAPRAEGHPRGRVHRTLPALAAACRRAARPHPRQTRLLPFGALCYYSLPDWARQMYGVLPEVPSSTVTAALKAFRLTMNSIPEPAHDRAFTTGTREMLDSTRGRLAMAGYDTAKGLRGLTDPRRRPDRLLRTA